MLVSPVEDPAVTNVLTNTAIVPDDPKQVLQDYDSLMIALTQKFCATLATIADAAKRGDLSSEQAREMSAERGKGRFVFARRWPRRVQPGGNASAPSDGPAKYGSHLVPSVGLISRNLRSGS